MRAAAALLCVLLGGLALAHAEDPPTQAPEGVAWFTSLAEARKVGEATGRPIFVAMHVRPAVASPTATERTRRWLQAYTDPAVVKLSRQCACVLRVVSAPEGKDPDVDRGAPAAIHLVIDGSSRVLARLDADLPAAGGALKRLLRHGLRNHGPIPRDAPEIDAKRVTASERRLEGVSPMRPVSVPVGVPGVRVRLRWELPAPKLGDEASQTIKARVLMRWDEVGPLEVGALTFEAGQEIDVPIDVRFDEHEALAEHTAAGLHRLDLYLEPDVGSYPFSKGPLHVGRVWIDLGDGGGGGGGDSQTPEPEPDPKKEDDQQPDPTPDGQPEQPPVEPEQARDDVVDPFIGEGETVKKDDAIVAVEDEDAGVKPPPQMPLEKALREFEKKREKAIGREGLTPSERAFLRRYFELLRKHAKPAGAPK